MVSNILLIFLVSLVVISYLVLLVSRVMKRKKRIEDYTGFDIAKEITTNYDDINIVSSGDIIFSEYNIKRNVIRLNSKNYDGNSLFDIITGAILAGFSLVNSDNSKYFKFSFIFKRINCISFIPLIMVILSCFVNNMGDAKIGLVVLGFMLIYLYMRYIIMNEAVILIEDKLDNKTFDKIKSILVRYVNFYKISFVGGLVSLLRLVVIIIGI